MKSDQSASLMADSSGLISLLSQTDSNHHRALIAIKKFEGVAGSILVPAEVLSETLNLIGKKFGHEVAIDFYTTLDKSGAFFVIDSTPEIREEAFSLFKKQPGPVSFTDCLVMASAEIWGTKQIFGFDEAFRKNGYQIPL